MEKRRALTAETKAIKASSLPFDYLKLVNEVFTTNFNGGLEALKKVKPAKPRFEATGTVYPDEVILCVTLMHEGEIAATSVYASTDFDPKASAPTVQDLLAACVDAI